MTANVAISGFGQIGRDYLRPVLAAGRDDLEVVAVHDVTVSTDVIGDASCVFDVPLTQASGRLVTVFGGYDDAWGHTTRLLDLTRLVAQRG